MLKRLTNSVRKRNLVWFCIYRKKKMVIEQEIEKKEEIKEDKTYVLSRR